MSEEYVGYKEAQDLLCVSYSRMKHIVSAGGIKKYTLDGVGVRFLKSDVETYARLHARKRKAKMAYAEGSKGPKSHYVMQPGGWKDALTHPEHADWPLAMVCTECGTLEKVENWLVLARSGHLEAILPQCGHSWDCYQPKRLPL